ncbi:DUF4169 family protein [Faunimonas sp. B44]|uniref:DUF4169 family protein n=1 Tax=Faunimonas sp. B44 TaxID=3461493 RepID=UPI0040444D0D
MADAPINLRQARKRRAREEREKEAAANRTRFGLSRAERDRSAAMDALEERRHEAHRLGPGAPTPDGRHTRDDPD